MLTVGNGATLVRLAGLEDLAVAISTHGQWLSAEHTSERERASTKRPTGHTHPPVL